MDLQLLILLYIMINYKITQPSLIEFVEDMKIEESTDQKTNLANRLFKVIHGAHAAIYKYVYLRNIIRLEMIIYYIMQKLY